MMKTIVLAVCAMLLGWRIGWAQDVPGIELCTAETRMDRRTSCLQSNVNYLHQLLTKTTADTALKLKAAADEIAALKATLAKLQATVDALKAASSKPETKK
jgi:hypothetical protein